MVRCPACEVENDHTSKRCSACGAALSSELDSTEMPSSDSPPNFSAPAHLDSSHHGRFLPGTRVADRYRIVSLVGKGGMGEVYRADDLKLGHTVALKFLPKDLSDSPRRLEYFHNEVRLTRQISHPNICRVHDVGEVDGQHFLSMEYIDGEDLKALLRRIGRLPRQKGIEVAQQLCAGLAAAHSMGVLHRDLKPANIMLDGRGRVRITDFGLAQVVSDQQVAEVAGTPAYMAPEQLREGRATIQSDLYALGLILHEIFTGKPVFRPGTMQELLRAHEESSISRPSRFIDDMDAVLGSRHLIAEIARALLAGITFGLLVLMLLLLSRQIIRRDRWAALVVILICVIFFTIIHPGNPYLAALVNTVNTTAIIWLLNRCGIFAAVTAYFTVTLLSLPITADVNHFYFSSAIFLLFVVFAIAAYGAYISLDKRALSVSDSM